jgi:predicted dehydrogenase
MAVRVALIGANGHGRWHRRQLADSPHNLVALCDVAPVTDTGGVPVYTDHTAMLAEQQPDIVIVATPPPTHRPIATDALRAGADVLLEKPPVLTLAEHDALSAVLAESGRALQVGFQALGSAALTRLLEAIDAGRLGTVTGVAAAGAWWRPDSYWTRSAWAGQRAIDGALVNAFAHAVMQCLAIARRPVQHIELERYRTRDIGTDDTATLRLTGDGSTVSVAVTLCSTEFVAGEITVTGTEGTAVLEYPTDRLKLPGDDDFAEVPGRQSLLDNLAAYPGGGPLIVPLERTKPFTAIVEAIGAAPRPALVADEHLIHHPDGTGRAIAGVADAVRAAAAKHALFSELGGQWTGSPGGTT